jgi:hypothetical protein
MLCNNLAAIGERNGMESLRIITSEWLGFYYYLSWMTFIVHFGEICVTAFDAFVYMN